MFNSKIEFIVIIIIVTYYLFLYINLSLRFNHINISTKNLLRINYIETQRN